MIIYKCKISGDEMLTDSFRFKIVHDFFYEVEGKTRKESNKIDDSLIGGNASAEEQMEQAEDSEESVIDVIANGRLKQTGFKKKDYQLYIKKYIKTLLDKITEEKGAEAGDDFKKRAAPAVKALLENFNDLDFYTGESMDTEGMVVVMNYKEDGVTPFFWFIKDGFDEEKQ